MYAGRGRRIVRKEQAMGYDIVTVESDEKLAQKFAAKYQYTYLFDKDTGKYDGGGQVYFRANIWTMGVLRNVMYKLFYTLGMDDAFVEQFMNAVSWNDGERVSPDALNKLFTALNKQANQGVENYLEPIVTTVTLESWDPEKDNKVNIIVDNKLVVRDYSLEDKNKDTMAFTLEFLDYMEIAKDLGGFEVY
tara:strand:- start:449 stop:1021 length:573 start_codon:yes stop_codon:yes gene_type:complete